MTRPSLPSSVRSFATITLAALLLAACGGGGGGGADTAAPPVTGVTPPVADVPVTVMGTVTGFGSVIIDGTRFDDGAASVKVDTNPTELAAGSLPDVKLGMHVEATSSGGKLSNVTIRAALMGVVGAVDAAGSSFTVHQQTVGVLTTGATPTVFEGLSGLAALTAGDVVEVHGTVDETRKVVATRVERKARTDVAAGTRVGGLVQALDATAQTFKLGNLTVNFSAATVVPAGKTLANGQLVAVFALAAPPSSEPLTGGPGVAQVLVAKSLKIVTPEEGGGLAVGGRVMAYVSLADFTVQGVRIDASTASLEGGTAADVVAGANVAVQGTVTAGVLKATKLRVLKSSDDVKASLLGPVTDFVSSASFKVRGATVDASAAALTGGTAADLGNGANVKVTGRVLGEVLKATSVEFVAPPATGTIKLKGEVRELNASAGTFRFLGVRLKLQTSTQFVGGVAADLANGKRIEVTGTAADVLAAAASTLVSGEPPVVNVSKLEFLTDTAVANAVVVSGRVDGLNLGDGRLVNPINGTGTVSFKLTGVEVAINGSTTFTGGAELDLSNGMQVLVKGNLTANATTGVRSLVATSIEIRKPEDRPAGLVVVGAVSDFVSKSSFRIGQQKVDASNAVFSNGVEADLANGRAVEGTGTLAGAEGARYVVLSKLRFIK
jgi:Domain of unknown function (DUF5666)